jgi:hypothetical protein
MRDSIDTLDVSLGEHSVLLALFRDGPRHVI